MIPDLVKQIEKKHLKSKLPDVRPGDSVKVKTKIKEGNKERIQAYEGVVIKVRGSGINKTITVRRVFQGVGVERVFLLHSPKVDGIQVLRKGDVRRAKLYYLRERTGKAARIREKLGANIAAEVEIYREEPAPMIEESVVAEEATQPEAAAEEAPVVEAATETSPETSVEPQPEEPAAE